MGMELREAVTLRLSMLGYALTEGDAPALDYLEEKCRQDLLTSIHHKELPEGLFYTLADMVAGVFLQERLAAGTLEIEGMDFSGGGAKSITEGDISVTFAGASDGVDSPESRFLARLAAMTHPAEDVLGAYRRLAW